MRNKTLVKFQTVRYFLGLGAGELKYCEECHPRFLLGNYLSFLESA